MFVSKNELTARYAQYPNDRLVEILFEKDQYEPEAVQIAHEELAQRKVNLQDEIDEYLDKKELIRIHAEKTALIQLSIWEKLLFFFLWMAPLFKALRMNYSEDGLEQKVKQSHFFSRIGFGSLILCGVTSLILNLSTFQSLSLLGCLFMLTLYADKKRNSPH